MHLVIPKISKFSGGACPQTPLGELQAAGAFGPNQFCVGLYAPSLFYCFLATPLEKTQRFALRGCCKEWSAPYSDLLDLCQVPSLSNRRKAAKMCHLYKIVHRLVLWIVKRLHGCSQILAMQYNCRRSI